MPLAALRACRHRQASRQEHGIWQRQIGPELLKTATIQPCHQRQQRRRRGGSGACAAAARQDCCQQNPHSHPCKPTLPTRLTMSRRRGHGRSAGEALALRMTSVRDPLPQSSVMMQAGSVQRPMN